MLACAWIVKLTVFDRGDIDLDFADRTQALATMSYVEASIVKDGKITRHNTGVYFHAVPTDPVTGLCSWDYETANQKGMYKIDMLNVSVYQMVRNEQHLLDLMNRPMPWHKFEDDEFVSKLFHLGNHSELVAKLKPTSIEEIAMVLALIRPGKKHLQTQCQRQGFESIAQEIWRHEPSDGYVFKKAHSFSYAMLVYVHAQLLLEGVELSTELFG